MVAAERAPPPAPRLAVDVPPPIPPDEGLEFRDVRDRAPISWRENLAYATLLERTRDTPAAELAKESRREVMMPNLYGRPAQYRGVPIHLEGTAIKVEIEDQISEGLTPKGRLFQVWVITPESRGLPYCLVVEEPPKDLPIGDRLDVPIAFDGYFFKLFSYQALLKERVAPLLVGRLRTTAPPAGAAHPFQRPKWMGDVPWALPVLGVLMIVSLALGVPAPQELPAVATGLNVHPAQRPDRPRRAGPMAEQGGGRPGRGG